jgi:hypothetical protein
LHLHGQTGCEESIGGLFFFHVVGDVVRAERRCDAGEELRLEFREQHEEAKSLQRIVRVVLA